MNMNLKKITLTMLVAISLTIGTCYAAIAKGTLTVAIDGEPRSLDPSRSSDSLSAGVLVAMSETLTRMEQDENGNDIIRPAGAKSWNISDNGLIWTFNLRDFNWADGKPVTAEDYAYAIRRSVDPATACPYAFLLEPIKNASKIIEGKATVDDLAVIALDDKTLQITLEQPCPYFLDLTYVKMMHPQRKDYVEKHGDRFGTEPDTVIASGPFIVGRWDHNSRIVLKKNPSYWDAENVHLEEVILKIIKDDSATMGELLNGAIDVAKVQSAEWVKRLDKTDKFNVINGYSPRTWYLFFNQEVPPFENAKVRQAFSLALPRDLIQHVMFQDMNKAAYGWVPPMLQVGGMNFRDKVDKDPIKELIAENPDPKKLLIEGLKEQGMDPDPGKLKLILLQPGTGDAKWHKDFGELLQATFKQTLGVSFSLERVEWPLFQARNRSQEYQFAYKSWGGDYNDPRSFFEMWRTGCKIVPTGWSSEEYDKMLDLSAQTMDQEKRFDNFKRAEQILIKEEAAIAPLVYNGLNVYINKRVDGLMYPLFGSMEFKYVRVAD